MAENAENVRSVRMVNNDDDSVNEVAFDFEEGSHCPLLTRFLCDGILDQNVNQIRYYLTNRLVNPNETFTLIIDDVEYRNSTALHLTLRLCPENDIQTASAIIHELLTYGIKSVLQVDSQGTTPLHLACIHGHVDIVGVLCDAGSDLGALWHSQTPVLVACNFGRDAAVAELIRRGASTYGAIHVAAMEGNTYMLQKLHDAGVTKLNELDDDGLAPIHYTCIFGCLDALRWLIEHDAEVGIRCEALDYYGGNTCLHIAADQGHKDVLLELLEHQEVDSRDKTGNTPLMTACHAGRMSLASLLLNHGADVNAYSFSTGKTLLHEASSKANASLVRFLLGYGARTDLMDRGTYLGAIEWALQGSTAESSSSSSSHPKQDEASAVESIFELVRHNTGVHGCISPMNKLHSSRKRRTKSLFRLCNEAGDSKRTRL